MVRPSLPVMRAAHRLYERAGFARAPERDWSPVAGVELLAFAISFDLSELRQLARCGSVERSAIGWAVPLTLWMVTLLGRLSSSVTAKTYSP